VRILYFDDFRLGVLAGDRVVDVGEHVAGVPHTGPHDLVSGLIERFDDNGELVNDQDIARVDAVANALVETLGRLGR